MNVQPQSLMDINGDELKVKFTNSTGQTRNFLDCVKSRGETVSPIESAVKADIMCHIADIAMRLQRKLTFDMKGERFLGDDAANRRLRARLMRRPWKLRA
jgi:hypothetical protein